MKISNRLKAIASLINDNAIVLDVGCDHSLLGIYLRLYKNNIKIIASDPSIEALKRAKENIEKYNITKGIKLVNIEGVRAITKEVDTVVFAGMGATTILDIISSSPGRLNFVKNTIIASNNDHYILRKRMAKLGYIIKEELIIKEKKHYYPIILFQKGWKRYKKIELKEGPILIKRKDEIFISYINFQLNTLKKIEKNLPKKYFLKKIKIKKEIRELTKLL